MNTHSKSSPESPAKEQPGNGGVLLSIIISQAHNLPRSATAQRIVDAAEALIEKLGQGWIPARPDLVQVTRAFLQSLECPECDGSGWHTNTGPDPEHDPCAWCEARDRFLAGDVPPPPERP